VLVEIIFKCRGDDIYPKVKKFSPEDQEWFTEKCLSEGPSPIKMNLDEAVRMLKAFNTVEEINFDIR
jgi:hypothetical protein